jgi:AcrR family transcriptional regulator
VTTSMPRRERVRRATIDEIKQTAREQLASHGTEGLSLRAVARAMGLTASALYRYFPSRDDLITEMIIDGFGSLADALEAALEQGSGGDAGHLWMTVAHGYRRWAHEHSTEYALIFGTPIPGYAPADDRTTAQLHRSAAALFACMSAGLADGTLNPSRFAAQLTPELRSGLAAWGAKAAVAIPPEGMAGCMLAWTQLHGFLSLELFGHLPSVLGSPDPLFDQQMHDLLERLGYRPATADSGADTGADAPAAGSGGRRVRSG